MTISRWDPPYRCEVLHHGWLVNGSAVFEVVPLDADQARFVWVEWLSPPLGLLGAWVSRSYDPSPSWAFGCRCSDWPAGRPVSPVIPGETAA